MGREQLEPGTLLNDRYRILRVIGKGGMGTVYQAEHVRLDTILAVKEVRVPPQADTDAQAVLEQCEHEARFLVRLHHPNLPQVTDAFVEAHRFFVVMEYIEGVTLEAKLRTAGNPGLPVGSVIEWGLQIADVLAYLHSQDPPIIFRDLKPSNVMLQSDGRIRLIDFGIARRFQPGAVKDTALLGSVGYSPPEQFGRHQTDTRSDIYSFGATLHHLLTGRDPAHSPFKFTPADALNPSVPASLSRLLDRCLRLDADARPAHIHEVAMELLAIRDTLPVMPEPPVVPLIDIPPESMPGNPSGSPKIILTHPTQRGSGKTPSGAVRSTTLPAGGSSQIGVLGNETGRASGSPSGPSREAVPPVVTEAEPAASARPMVIGVGLAFVALAAGLAVYLTRLPRPAARPPVHPIAQPALPVNPQPPSAEDPHSDGAQVPANPPGITPADTGSLPAATQNHAVTFQNIAVKDVVVDGQGKAWLRLAVSGTAQGQKGDQETLAAFFYDSQNAPMASQLPQSSFASKNGQLSIAAQITLAAETSPFDLMLEIPVNAFPTPLPEGVQFHLVAFFENQRIGESQTYTPIPANLFNGVASPTNGAETPPQGNDAGPTLSPAPSPGRGRIFGTRRGGE